MAEWVGLMAGGVWLMDEGVGLMTEGVGLYYVVVAIPQTLCECKSPCVNAQVKW